MGERDRAEYTEPQKQKEMKVINGVKMYSSQEVADMFGITIPTLAKMRKRGLIRSIQIGRAKYTSDEAIKEYLNGLIEPKNPTE